MPLRRIFNFKLFRVTVSRSGGATVTVVDNLNASECTCTESESVYADWVNVLYDYMLRCGAAMINVFSGLVCLAALFVILWICWVFSSWLGCFIPSWPGAAVFTYVHPQQQDTVATFVVFVFTKRHHVPGPGGFS